MSDLLKRIDGWQYDVPADMKLHALLMDCASEIQRLTLANETLKAYYESVIEDGGKRIKALESSGEPVAWMQIDINDKPTNLFFNSVPEDDYHTYRPLYTAPPSIDALIAQAIKDYIAKVTVIKSVNLRTQAQPYLDELIAEIDEWGYRVGGKPDIKEIVDKWRTK